MAKRFLAAVAASFVALASTGASALDKVTFMLDWVPSGEEPYPYVATQRGYFAQEGLDVTIRIGRGSTDVITKMATGVAEIGAGAVGSLLRASAESNVPLKAVLSIYTKQPDAIFTVKGSGITSIKDLAGRTMATAPFSSSNTIWPVFAAQNGLDAEKVTLLKTDPNTIIPLLATGKADATMSWVTNAGTAKSLLKQAGKELVILPWSDLGLDGYGLSIFATDKVIKENPTLVARFVRAYQKAIAFTLSDPAAAAKDNNAMLPDISPEHGLAEWQHAEPLIKNEITDKFGMGTFDAALLKKTWEWVAKAQNYPMDKINPESTVDRSFVVVPKT
jgi:NitT/TauT family transport system substrate-binding protein